MLNNIKKWLGLDYYVSEFDQFIAHYDKTHPNLSLSQRIEKEKYHRIYRLRDKPVSQESKENFWNNF